VDNRQLINFSTYNYLGLNGHRRIVEAAKAALEQYGVSASASRLVAGERPPHRDLERALADLHGSRTLSFTYRGMRPTSAP